MTAYDHFLTPFLFLDNFYKETDERCTCPVPCETISFNPVLSFATFPSEKYIIEATNKRVGNVSKEERLKFREFIRYKTRGEAPSKWLLVSLSKDVLEGRKLRGSAVFSFLGNDFAQIFGQIVFMRLKALSNPNLEALWHIKRERDSLPLDVRRSKTL